MIDENKRDEGARIENKWMDRLITLLFVGGIWAGCTWLLGEAGFWCIGALILLCACIGAGDRDGWESPQ